MPNNDGTGPKGEGALTGRQLGKCKGARASVGNGRRNCQGPRSCGRGAGRRMRE